MKVSKKDAMATQRSNKTSRIRKFEKFSNQSGMKDAEARYASIEETIRSIPVGKVATYGQVAEAAGYPRGHRLVATFLREVLSEVPWQRVVGAGGEIKIQGSGATKQRSLLKGEGVVATGKHIDMDTYGHVFDI